MASAVPRPDGVLDPELLDPDGDIEVWGAGVIACEKGSAGDEVLVVYRPDRDDWSLPKGKVDPGETLAECARRELLEETGYDCELGPPVGLVRYRDAAGRAKAVVYFLADVTGGEFRANTEVSEERWLEPAAADRLLTYPRDRDLVRRAIGGAGASFTSC